MIEKIRKIRQNRIVKQLFSLKRIKKLHNFDSLNTIGIIFDITTEERWKQIDKIVKKFEKAGKKVYLVGKREGKSPDLQGNFIITNMNVSIVNSKTDINCWGIPKEQPLKAFFDRKYDILIDATSNNGDFFPIFVVLHSLSELRVSRSNVADDSKKIYDLLLNMDDNISEIDFLEQVVHYLMLINK